MNYSGRKSIVIRDYILLGIGTLLIALAVKEYLIPCQIVTGSVSGLALLFNEVFGIDTSLLTLLMNLSCLLIGTCFLGKKFGLRCVYISLLLPLAMALIPEYEPLLTSSPFINCLLFLVLLTNGQCIMLALDTTSGGLDTIAEVLARKLHASSGMMIGLLGALVSILTISVYGLGSAIKGVLVTLANGAMIQLLFLIKDKSKTTLRRLRAKA
ncbi:MAG: YitT family protein [Erysipelotrichaceae bacterium]|nr:YitT family protein [Erysipelotrichaceae bacterium]MBQ1625098.1 YitT family protein [Erysipelotrichaceae bacterium]MBQ2505293.1 YitT family protein [Erysipelotrichaceae bacterium]MBQ3962881.1 YitT family protein [Erysipelotrichaceae bacterium]MBQ3993712.1 YitT family protein [Erysipelotrichaceae bacterium]